MKPKPVPESHLYAAVYFDSAESARRALQVSVRIFGVAIEVRRDSFQPCVLGS